MTEKKTGWSDAEIDDARSSTRVITRGKDGAVVRTKGEDADRGRDAPPRCAGPTPPGSATPSGPASSPGWPAGWRTARCAEVGSMLATYVIETVGTQEYVLGTQRGSSTASPRRTARQRGREVAAHLRCPRP